MDKKNSPSPKQPLHFTFPSAPLLPLPEPTQTPSTPWYKHVYFYTICSGILGFASGYGVASLNKNTCRV